MIYIEIKRFGIYAVKQRYLWCIPFEWMRSFLWDAPAKTFAWLVRIIIVSILFYYYYHHSSTAGDLSKRFIQLKLSLSSHLCTTCLYGHIYSAGVACIFNRFEQQQQQQPICRIGIFNQRFIVLVSVWYEMSLFSELSLVHTRIGLIYSIALCGDQLFLNGWNPPITIRRKKKRSKTIWYYFYYDGIIAFSNSNLFIKRLSNLDWPPSSPQYHYRFFCRFRLANCNRTRSNELSSRELGATLQCNIVGWWLRAEYDCLEPKKPTLQQ